MRRINLKILAAIGLTTLLWVGQATIYLVSGPESWMHCEVGPILEPYGIWVSQPGGEQKWVDLRPVPFARKCGTIEQSTTR